MTIVFSDEGTFHLSDKINCHNAKIWVAYEVDEYDVRDWTKLNVV